MSRLLARLTSFGAGALLLLAACAPSQPTPAPSGAGAPGQPSTQSSEPRGTLTVIDELGTERWLLRTATAEQPLWYIGEPLFWWDWEKDAPVTKAIVESYDSKINPDGSVDWTFKIRKGVKFHKNQGEVTAEDVKFTFTEFLKPGSVNANTKMLTDFFGADASRLIVEDQYTLKIKSPKVVNVVELLRVMSAEEARTLRPFSKKYFEQVGEEEFAKNPVYAGPYELASHSPGSEVRLKAVPEHYRVKPGYAEIRYLKVNDEATRMAMLRSGQVDIAPIPGRLVRELQGSGIKIVQSKNASEPFVAFGGLYPTRPNYDPSFPWTGPDPLAERPTKVRKALNLAVDRKAIVDRILFGYGEVGALSFSFIGPGNPWWNNAWTPYPFDVAEAKKLMTEAGYPQCFEINMWLTVGQVYTSDMAEAVASMWERNLGCKINRRSGEYQPTLRTMLVERNTNGWAWAFQGGPIARPQRYACLHGGPTYQVVTHTELPFYSEICSKSDVTLDQNELVRLEREIGDAQYKYYATVPIATAHATYGIGTKVKEWVPMPKKATMGLLEYAQPN